MFSKISKSQKLKILLNEKIPKNRKIVFAHISKQCPFFGTKENLVIYGGTLANFLKKKKNPTFLNFFV